MIEPKLEEMTFLAQFLEQLFFNSGSVNRSPYQYLRFRTTRRKKVMDGWMRCFNV